MVDFKEIYEKLEDKYYSFLDALEKKGVPVYKAVDFLEEKNIPSFPVAILLSLILLVLLVSVIGGAFFPENAMLTLKVVDANGNALPNTSIEIAIDDYSTIEETNVDGFINLQVPIGARVQVNVRREGYLTVKDAFDVKEIKYEKNITLELESTTLTREIYLKDLDTKALLDKKSVQLAFSCSQGDYSKPFEIVNNGKIVLDDIPKDCGRLYVTPKGYTTSMDTIELEDDGTVIDLLLSEIPIEKGSVLITVTDEAGTKVTGLTVRLYTENDSYLTKEFTSEAGTAKFDEVPEGKYYASVSDERGIYETETFRENVKEVIKDETTYYDLEVRKGIVGKIRLLVLDKTTGNPIVNAKVTLSKLTKGDVLTEIGEANFTDLEGKVSFSVADAGSYTAIIDHGSYLIESSKNITKKPEGTYDEILLTPATAANSSTLSVFVSDEQGNGIEGVRARLLVDGEPFGDERSANAGGYVFFERLDARSYQVKAFLPGFTEKVSELVSVQERKENSVEIVLPLGTGTLQVSIASEESEPVAGATVSVYDYFTDKEIEKNKLVDSQGQVSINVRSDRKVYLVVEAIDYLNYTTAPIQMGQDVTRFVEVRLADDVPKLEAVLLGLYEGTDIVQDFLTPASKYVAKIQLRIPREASLDEAGIHLRTGEATEEITNIMEEDPLFLKNVEASAGRITKGVSFSPPKGFGQDMQKLTNGSSKWTSIVWKKPRSGVYEVLAEVQVNPVEQGKRLMLSYRGWGKVGTYIRNPVDNELQGKEQTANKQALYSATKTKFYSAGPSNICTQQFCNIYVMEELNKGLATSIINEYSADISGNYKLSFTISNNGNSLYNDVKLNINSSDSLGFKSYNANIKGKNYSNELDSSGLEIEMGNMSPGEVVFGSLDLAPEKEGTTSLNLELVSGKEKIYVKTINVSVKPAKKMEVEILPKAIVPYIDNRMLVSVMDSDKNSPVKRASVYVFLNEDLIGTTTTDNYGIANFTLPAPSNGSKVTIFVRKPSYREVRRFILVSESIVETVPDLLNATLIVSESEGILKGFRGRNITELNLLIQKVEAVGEFLEYADLKWRENNEGKEMTPNQDYNFSFELNLTNKGKNIAHPKRFKGVIKIEVFSPEYNRTWISTVPVELFVTFGGALDDPKCLIVDPLKWNLLTSDQTKTLEVTLKNNCTVDGNPIDLQNFEARINRGNSNALGDFEIEDFEGEKIKLMNIFKKVADIIPKGEDSVYTFSFDPKPLDSAKSKPKIVLKAVNKTEAGDEAVQVTIKVDLQINKLSKCVKVVTDGRLLIESCPTNTGYGAYQGSSRYNYNPTTVQPPWLVRGESTSNTNVYGAANRTAVNRRGRFGASEANPYSNAGSYPYSQYQNPYYNNANQNPAAAQGWACGRTSFRIENSCSSAVEVDIQAHPTLMVEQDDFDLEPGADARTNIGQSYRVGKYPVEVYARIKGGDTGSELVKRLEITVDSPSSLYSRECISLRDPADGTFNFNSILDKPFRGKIANTCKDMGVRFPPQNAITKESFLDSHKVIQYVRTSSPYNITEGSKTVEILEFTLKRNPQSLYQNYRRLDTRPTSPLAFIGNARGWAAGAWDRVQTDSQMTVTYLDPVGTIRSHTIDIQFEDWWKIGEGVDALLQWGARDLNDFGACLKKSLFADVKVGDREFGTGNVYRYTPNEFFIVSARTCGWADRITSVAPQSGTVLSKDGVTLAFAPSGSHKIQLTVTKSADFDKAQTIFQGYLKVRVTRGLLNAQSKDANMPFKVTITKGKIPGLNEQETIAYRKIRSSPLNFDCDNIQHFAKGTITPTFLTRMNEITEYSSLTRASKQKVRTSLIALCNATQVAQLCDSSNPNSGLRSSDKVNKLLLKWGWDDIIIGTLGTCESGSYYCDGTQSAIAVHKKVKTFRQPFDTMLRTLVGSRTGYAEIKAELAKQNTDRKLCLLSDSECEKYWNSKDIYRILIKQTALDKYDTTDKAVYFQASNGSILERPSTLRGWDIASSVEIDPNLVSTGTQVETQLNKILSEVEKRTIDGDEYLVKIDGDNFLKLLYAKKNAANTAEQKSRIEEDKTRIMKLISGDYNSTATISGKQYMHIGRFIRFLIAISSANMWTGLYSSIENVEDITPKLQKILISPNAYSTAPSRTKILGLTKPAIESLLDSFSVIKVFKNRDGLSDEEINYIVQNGKADSIFPNFSTVYKNSLKKFNLYHYKDAWTNDFKTDFKKEYSQAEKDFENWEVPTAFMNKPGVSESQLIYEILPVKSGTMSVKLEREWLTNTTTTTYSNSKTPVNGLVEQIKTKLLPNSTISSIKVKHSNNTITTSNFSTVTTGIQAKLASEKFSKIYIGCIGKLTTNCNLTLQNIKVKNTANPSQSFHDVDDTSKLRTVLGAIVQAKANKADEIQLKFGNSDYTGDTIRSTIVLSPNNNTPVGQTTNMKSRIYYAPPYSIVSATGFIGMPNVNIERGIALKFSDIRELLSNVNKASQYSTFVTNFKNLVKNNFFVTNVTGTDFAMRKTNSFYGSKADGFMSLESKGIYFKPGIIEIGKHTIGRKIKSFAPYTDQIDLATQNAEDIVNGSNSSGWGIKKGLYETLKSKTVKVTSIASPGQVTEIKLHYDSLDGLTGSQTLPKLTTYNDIKNYVVAAAKVGRVRLLDFDVSKGFKIEYFEGPTVHNTTSAQSVKTVTISNGSVPNSFNDIGVDLDVFLQPLFGIEKNRKLYDLHETIKVNMGANNPTVQDRIIKVDLGDGLGNVNPVMSVDAKDISKLYDRVKTGTNGFYGTPIANAVSVVQVYVGGNEVWKWNTTPQGPTQFETLLKTITPQIDLINNSTREKITVTAGNLKNLYDKADYATLRTLASKSVPTVNPNYIFVLGNTTKVFNNKSVHSDIEDFFKTIELEVAYNRSVSNQVKRIRLDSSYKDNLVSRTAQNNVFLYLPFDGSVGKTSSSLGRNGYGVTIGGMPSGTRAYVAKNASSSLNSSNVELIPATSKAIGLVNFPSAKINQGMTNLKNGIVFKANIGKPSEFVLNPSYPIPLGLSMKSNGTSIPIAAYAIQDAGSIGGSPIKWKVNSSTMRDPSQRPADFSNRREVDDKITNCNNRPGVINSATKTGNVEYSTVAFIPYGVRSASPYMILDTCSRDKVELFTQKDVCTVDGGIVSGRIPLTDTITSRVTSNYSLDSLAGIIEVFKKQETNQDPIFCMTLPSDGKSVEIKWNPQFAITNTFRENLSRYGFGGIASST